MAGTFALDISRFAQKTNLKTGAAIRRVFFDAAQRIVLKTPVDTGRARANWIPSIGKMDTSTSDKTDKQGAATLSKVRAVGSSFKPGTVAFLTNNLPYIRELERGSSRQAPAGMVGVTMVEIQTIFEQAAKDAK